jgi:hypothetical protein
LGKSVQSSARDQPIASSTDGGASFTEVPVGGVNGGPLAEGFTDIAYSEGSATVSGDDQLVTAVGPDIKRPGWGFDDKIWYRFGDDKVWYPIYVRDRTSGWQTIGASADFSIIVAGVGNRVTNKPQAKKDQGKLYIYRHPCFDRVMNNVETDVDCGGSFCTAKCAIDGEKMCVENSDCKD